ncbi:MAG: hypothetical protein U1F77_09485 [Kiritimatiellia bacterium]
MDAPPWPRPALSRLPRALRLALAAILFYWPAAEVLRLAASPSFRATGRPPQLGRWMEATAGRFESWAVDFHARQKAAAADTHDVAATEWPMFDRCSSCSPSRTPRRCARPVRLPAEDPPGRGGRGRDRRGPR